MQITKKVFFKLTIIAHNIISNSYKNFKKMNSDDVITYFLYLISYINNLFQLY